MHLVLEDYASYYHGDGCGDVSGEAKRGCGGSDVSWCDETLKGDEGGLEVRADSDSAYDLVTDDLAPSRGSRNVDEKAVSEGHDEEAAVDWW